MVEHRRRLAAPALAPYAAWVGFATVLTIELLSHKMKKAPPGSSGGAVTDPDKMVKVQVASDIK